MYFSMLRSLTQPFATAYCMYPNAYDPGFSQGSADLGMVYLRSNLSKQLMHKYVPSQWDSNNALLSC